MNKSMTKLKITLLVLTVIAVVCLFSTQSLADEDSDQPAAPSNAITVGVDPSSQNYINIYWITGQLSSIAIGNTYEVSNDNFLIFKDVAGNVNAEIGITPEDKKWIGSHFNKNGSKIESLGTVADGDSFTAVGIIDPNMVNFNVAIHGNGSVTPNENPIQMGERYWIEEAIDNEILLNDAGMTGLFKIIAVAGENATFDHFDIDGSPIQGGGQTFTPGNHTLNVYFSGETPGNASEIAQTSDSTMPGIIGLAAIGICAAGVLIIRRKFN